MELITQINKALKYIEENIKNDIDYSIICKICCCSLPKIQQIFLFTCGISISEYIRKRRMTVAAHEIMNTKVKVVDLALKLGYNSPESFTRAYKLFHDVTPTDTRNKKSYKEYFPISIQLQVYGGDNKLGNEPIVLIETERLKIRKFKSDDWKDLLDIAISKENSQFDSRDHKWPTDEVGIKNACEYFAKENQFWAVEVKDLEKVICFVNFNYIDENRKLDIGHVMNEQYLGNDYEYECLNALYNYGFIELDAVAISAKWALGDDDKIDPLKKLGMKIIHTSKADMFNSDEDGTTTQFEVCELQITKKEWISKPVI